MGSAAASPPWLALLALASILTLGHLSIFITLLFLLTPPLAFIIFVNSLRHIGISNLTSSFGGILYVLTPLLWSSLNQGRLEILVLYLIAPAFVFIKPYLAAIETLTWRRIFAITLLVTIAGAFSPLLLAGWLFTQLFQLIRSVLFIRGQETKSAGWIDLLESEALIPVLRRVVVIVTALLLTLPWSLGSMVHPTQFLVAPGIPLANGGTLQSALANPGGVGSPPSWIIAPITLFIFFSWFIGSLRRTALYCSAILAVAILLNALHVAGHGATEPVYVGVAFLVIAIILIPPTLIQIEEIIPSLRNRHLGYTHIAIAMATVLSLTSTTVMAGWVAFAPTQSLVQSDQSDVIPAFVSSLAQSPAKPKTLVLIDSKSNPTFFITRGLRLAIGDADVSTGLPPEVGDAVNQLVTGAGINTSHVLGGFGIQYLFVEAPVSLDVARAIDGVGGFKRMSATDIGTVWRIVGASPRVLFTNKRGNNYLIPSGDIGAMGSVSSPGEITLAEKYDRSWRLIDNGVSVPLEHAVTNLPVFNVDQAGNVTLLFDGTAHRGLISLELLTLLVAVVMALPSGRRRRQVPLEELV
jgi:hypothetical protein